MSFVVSLDLLTVVLNLLQWLDRLVLLLLFLLLLKFNNLVSIVLILIQIFFGTAVVINFFYNI